MLEWQQEADRYSFDDSERFEEDSLCSWVSDSESLCNNWRGWKKQLTPHGHQSYRRAVNNEGVLSLKKLAAKTVACHIPFEAVEQWMPNIPHDIQLDIAYWSFPDSEEDIRLYSCLANGNADEFSRGDNMYRHGCVQEILQIGFHLSAIVLPISTGKGKFKVAVTFDRRRIIACNCTCGSSWCCHVVAVCLRRIHQPNEVQLRAPVSESLSQLDRNQLQKFAQYLISELPQQILPTAQRLIDEILSPQPSDINTVCGAPDPTAGASAGEKSAWWLDETNLHDNIHKIVVKFCVPSPTVFSDVNYLSSTAPPVAAEWQSLLRSLRGREPEGMWNLLSIVREMYKRLDHNSVPLLIIITEECIKTEKVLVWWFNTRVALHTGNSGHGNKNNMSSNSYSNQYACSSLCDEVVTLWRLAALNPALSPNERYLLSKKLIDWHIKVLDKVDKSKETCINIPPPNNGNNNGGNSSAKRASDMEAFPGFRPAIEATLLDWEEYPLSGITYSPSRYYSPILYCDNKPSISAIYADHIKANNMTKVERGVRSRAHNRTKAGASSWKVTHNHSTSRRAIEQSASSSSMSSEGFCEPDLPARDTDESPQPDSGQVSRQNSQNSRDGGRPSAVRVPQAPVMQRAAASTYGGRTVGVAYHGAAGAGEILGAVGGMSYHGAAEVNVAHWLSTTPNPNQLVRHHPRTHPRNEPGCPNHPVLDEELQPGASAASQQQQLANQLNSENSQDSLAHIPDIFKNLRRLDDPSEILFARAEGLHAHGHIQEASKLAVMLAEELLYNPPNLMLDLPTGSASRLKRKKIHPASHQLTLLASATLGKCAFLCSVLADHPNHMHLAFNLALFGLEMPRHPASTKPLEVKLAFQETELVSQLKRMSLRDMEMSVIREKAEQLRQGNTLSRGHALLPLMLASFVFDALVLEGSKYTLPNPKDEMLGFEAAVAAISMKANVSEADHPLLCEGTRKQRGDLALTLLTHYKEDQRKLGRIMDKFLDKEVHKMNKNLSITSFYSPHPSSNVDGEGDRVPHRGRVGVSSPCSQSGSNNTHSSGGSGGSGLRPPPSTIVASPTPDSVGPVNQSMAGLSIQNRPVTHGGARPKDVIRGHHQEEEAGEWEHYKAWQETHSKRGKRNEGRAGIGSDSCSSGNSSASVGSYVSDKVIEPPKAASSPFQSSHPSRPQRGHPTNDTITVRHQTINGFHKGVRYKGKRAYPTVPNQPSEANAYFMFEMAKTVLNKAGGSSSTSLFKQPSSSQNPRGPHKALQMCAFQIALYGLGIHNSVSPNWLSRTYSSHVSWISNQVMEIGTPALIFLIDTWEGHLTPQEAALIADKASSAQLQTKQATVLQAAKLALSCLPFAHALNPSEIQRAIVQCKEQSSDMLEAACTAIENAARGGSCGGIYPEVLFEVARCWYSLHAVDYKPKPTPARSRSNRCDNKEGPETGVRPPGYPVTSNGVPVSTAIMPPNNFNPSSPPSVYNVPPVSGAPPHFIPAPAGANLPPQYQFRFNYPQPHNVIANPMQFQMYLPAVTQPNNGMAPYHFSLPSTSIGVTQSNNPMQPHPGGGSFLPIGFHTQPPPPPNPNAPPAYIPLPPNGSSVVATQPISFFSTPPPLPPSGCNNPSPAIQQAANGGKSVQYLFNAYRVGIMAMETLGKRVQDERPQNKFATHPPFAEEIKWVLGLAKKLGNHYLHQFSLCCARSLTSPYILFDLCVDVSQYLSRQQSQGQQQLYHQPNMRSSPILHSLLQKCQQAFISCCQLKLYYITPTDYDAFVSVVRAARRAFQMMPGGMMQFNDLLQQIRRNKACKKELWQLLTVSLQQPSV